MKIAIRVDASYLIGTGHVMRCLCLADALASFGHSLIFYCQPLDGNLIDLILQRGHQVVTLRRHNTKFKAKGYLAWLERGIDEDVQDFLCSVKAADWVITDHYAIDEKWQTKVKAGLDCYIFAIDDLLRTHNADLILDQTLGREKHRYQSNGIALLGSNFALLSNNFLYYREQAFDKKTFSAKPRVLISMGGVDSPNATLKVAQVLIHQVNARLTVLLNPKAPHFHKVATFCQSHNIRHLHFAKDMPRLLSLFDIVIGAAGLSSIERACLGIPSIIIPIAENQRTSCQMLADKKAVMSIELQNIEKQLLLAFDSLIANWQSFRKVNFSLCDGRGLMRVCHQFNKLNDATLEDDIYFSAVTMADSKTIFDWQQHPLTRQFAYNPAVPDWTSHSRWMENKLNCYQDYFLLIKRLDKQTSKAQSCGVLRLDRLGFRQYLLSIFIAPEKQKQGIARKTLALVDVIFSNISIEAHVLKENIASQKLFSQSRFSRCNLELFIRQPLE